MLKANAVDLIAVSPEATGVGLDPAETKRRVFCTVKSVGMQEAYQAMGIGLNPELKVILAHDFEYQDEPMLELDGKRYRIIRTYVTETDGIELTIQKIAGNARPLPPDPEPEPTPEPTPGPSPEPEGVG